MSLDAIPKDVAKIIASYTGNFFPLSSTSRKLRRFFELERKAALKKVKIMVKENGNSSFLLTFEGRLYACGQNKNDHFGLGDKNEAQSQDIKCYKQWTPIGPQYIDFVSFPLKPISEVILDDENSVFVRCGKEWYGAGSHPYIQHAKRRTKSYSPWVRITPCMFFSIVELIPTSTHLFIRCRFRRGRENFWFSYGGNAETGHVAVDRRSSRIYWKKIKSPGENIEKLVVTAERVFLQCSNGWYGCGKNENGELGLGFTSAWEKWRKLGPIDKKVLQLKANQNNTFVFCDDEKWYGCGKNDRGQLGTGDIKTQLNWVLMGPQDKTIYSLYLQNGRTFVTTSDGLYFCGANQYEKESGNFLPYKDYLKWIYRGFNTSSIINMVAREDIDRIFVQYPEDWYVNGEEGEEEKLNYTVKKLIKLVISEKHVFACCEDGWYFFGDNLYGQSGVNDNASDRFQWGKIISHGEDIQELVRFSSMYGCWLTREPVAHQCEKNVNRVFHGP